MGDVKTQEEATGQSFSLGVGKRHDGKNRQSENKRGVPKAHNAEMVQIDTLINTNFIDLLSSLTDGH